MAVREEGDEDIAARFCLGGRNDHLVRTDRWALIRYGTGDIELYDMQADRRQFTNLSAGLKYKKAFAELLENSTKHSTK